MKRSKAINVPRGNQVSTRRMDMILMSLGLHDMATHSFRPGLPRSSRNRICVETWFPAQAEKKQFHTPGIPHRKSDQMQSKHPRKRWLSHESFPRSSNV